MRQSSNDYSIGDSDFDVTSVLLPVYVHSIACLDWCLLCVTVLPLSFFIPPKMTSDLQCFRAQGLTLSS
jgi:hypothetical protein